MLKIFLLVLAFAFIPSGYAQVRNTYPPPTSTQTLVAASTEVASQIGDDLMKPENIAMAVATADVMTTSLVIASGGVEMNPLVSSTPLGLVAFAATKIGLIKYAATLPEPEKRVTLKSTSSVWGGAAVNNIAVYLAAPPPFPIIAGLIMGFATWNTMSNNYDTADKKLAASLAKEPEGNDAYQKIQEISLVNNK
jgi:hypothetical protein